MRRVPISHPLFVRLCVALSASLTVSAVPILSLFSQANNPQQLKICSWPLLSFCKCNCDVFYTFLTTCSVTTMFSFCVFFFKQFYFYHFTSSFLSTSSRFTCIFHKHARKCHQLPICHCLLLLHFNLSLHTCQFRLRFCVEFVHSLLSHYVSFSHFPISFLSAIRCCKVPPCSSYSRCRCNHRARPSR